MSIIAMTGGFWYFDSVQEQTRQDSVSLHSDTICFINFSKITKVKRTLSITIYYVNLRNATIILYLAFKLPKLRKLMKITKITKSHENYHYTIIFAEIDKNLIMYLIVTLPLIKKVERKTIFMQSFCHFTSLFSLFSWFFECIYQYTCQITMQGSRRLKLKPL